MLNSLPESASISTPQDIATPILDRRARVARYVDPLNIDTRLKHGVLNYAVYRCDADGRLWPGALSPHAVCDGRQAFYRGTGRYLGLSERTIRYQLRLWESRGVLERVDAGLAGRGHKRTYRVNFRALAGLAGPVRHPLRDPQFQAEKCPIVTDRKRGNSAEKKGATTGLSLSLSRPRKKARVRAAVAPAKNLTPWRPKVDGGRCQHHPMCASIPACIVKTIEDGRAQAAAPG